LSLRPLKADVFQNLIKEEYERNKHDLLLRVGFAQQTYIAYIIKAIEDILNDEIVSRIRTKIISNGYSQKIADSVHIAASPIAKGPGLIAWMIISDYTADNGFPVAVMIENGRIAYTIWPKGKHSKTNNPLGLPGPGGGSDWLVFKIKDSGKTIFAKKVKIPRFIPTKYVKNTIRERQPMVQEKVNLATQRFISDVINDVGLP